LDGSVCKIDVSDFYKTNSSVKTVFHRLCFYSW